MIISKNVGKQYSSRPSVPIQCKSCGKRIKKLQAAKHEICPKCQRDRKY